MDDTLPLRPDQYFVPEKFVLVARPAPAVVTPWDDSYELGVNQLLQDANDLALLDARVFAYILPRREAVAILAGPAREVAVDQLGG